MTNDAQRLNQQPETPPGSDQLDAMVTILDLVRAGAARTKPELGRLSGLGRTVITQRVAELQGYGLLASGELGRSTGGRAPRELRLRADAGVILVAHLGARSVSAAVTDLAGEVLAEHHESGDIAAGPERTLDRVEEILDALRAGHAPAAAAPVFGVGIGLPGPVEFATGRPVRPPIMPGWDGYGVRDRLAARYDAPVWVDNDVNLMALGEVRAGAARGEANMIYVKVATGIGAGLISRGRLHRGAHGCAGDIGHVAVADGSGIICRCGNEGCLEALAGGAALAREGAAAARDGRSPRLETVAASGRPIDSADVLDAAAAGDATSVELMARSGRLVGHTLATLVNFFDPSLVILGGGVATAGDQLLAALRETVYRRSLPLATRDLRIQKSSLGRHAGVLGTAFMVIDELFSRETLGRWLADGTPAGRPQLAVSPT